MKYKKYPSYKDSEVEWLDEIPSEWTKKAIKYVAKLQGGYAFKSEFFNDTGIPIIRIGDIKENILWENCKKVDLSELPESIFRIRQNDTLIALSGATTGKTCYVRLEPKKAYINQRVARLGYTNKFLYYTLNSDIFQKNILLSADGSAQENISNSQIENMELSFPSVIEQQQIAKFLDNATQKMDTLIQKQENLIKLLKEKRQAVISHAVTRGLNPDVKFKDSGVEWLGEIPEHWENHKLKYAVNKIGDIDHDMPKSVSTGLPYLMTGDINEKASSIDFDNCKQISVEDYSKLSRKIKPDNGDLIFARYATIGTICYVDIQKDFLVSYSCVTIKPKLKKVLGKYLFYFFKSNFFFEDVKNYINSNTQGNVGIDSLYKIKFFYPLLEEQELIIKYLDNRTSKIDKLIKKATKSIKLLKEKRTALISAAVTGKIDIREIV